MRRCGGVRRITVAGTVLLDGQPLDGGLLEFNPDAAKGNMNKIVCMSPIKEGHYNLQTSGITQSDSGAGVPLGWYKVTFRLPESRVSLDNPDSLKVPYGVALALTVVLYGVLWKLRVVV